MRASMRMWSSPSTLNNLSPPCGKSACSGRSLTRYRPAACIPPGNCPATLEPTESDHPMASLLRILHLEDDPNDAELVQETLAAEGFACDVVRVRSEEHTS